MAQSKSWQRPARARVTIWAKISMSPFSWLQVVALGFFSGENTYLQSSWNVLDGVLVFVSIIDIIVSMASAGGAKILGVLRVLRLLRTLRPLRYVLINQRVWEMHKVLLNNTKN